METFEPKEPTVPLAFKALVDNYGAGLKSPGQVVQAVNDFSGDQTSAQDSEATQNATGPEEDHSAEVSMKRHLSELEALKHEGEHDHTPAEAQAMGSKPQSTSLANQLSITSLFHKIQRALAQANRRARRQQNTERNQMTKVPTSDLLPTKSLGKQRAAGLRQAASGLNPNGHKSSDDPGFDISA